MAKDFGKHEWRSADGTRTKFDDMDVDHFTNILSWVEGRKQSYSDTFIQELLNYASAKSFVLFCDNKPYPFREETGWIVIDPVSGTKGTKPPPQEYIDRVAELDPKLLEKLNLKN